MTRFHKCQGLPPVLRRLFWLILVLSLLCAPLVWDTYDMQEGGWLVWAQHSQGIGPWKVYQNNHPTQYIYPPMVPWILTGVEKIRLACHDLKPEILLRLSVVIVKLPNILGFVFCIPLLYFGLKDKYNEAYAKKVAIAFACCAPFFFNAALWGQWDALLIFFLLGALLSTLNDRPFLIGVFAGLALILKPQAIIFAPTIGLYLFRNQGLKGILKPLSILFIVMALFSLPMILHRAGGDVWASYAHMIDNNSYLTLYADNLWQIIVKIGNIIAPHWNLTMSDQGPFLGPLSAKTLGLTMISIYTLGVLIAFWQQTTSGNLILSTMMIAFAFFILPTQIHERYGLPALAVMALLAPIGGQREYIIFCITTLLNFLTTYLFWDYLRLTPNAPTIISQSVWIVDLLVSIVNVALFIVCSVKFFRTMGGKIQDCPRMETSLG